MVGFGDGAVGGQGDGGGCEEEWRGARRRTPPTPAHSFFLHFFMLCSFCLIKCPRHCSMCKHTDPSTRTQATASSSTQQQAGTQQQTYVNTSAQTRPSKPIWGTQSFAHPVRTPRPGNEQHLLQCWVGPQAVTQRCCLAHGRQPGLAMGAAEGVYIGFGVWDMEGGWGMGEGWSRSSEAGGVPPAPEQCHAQRGCSVTAHASASGSGSSLSPSLPEEIMPQANIMQANSRQAGKRQLIAGHKPPCHRPHSLD